MSLLAKLALTLLLAAAIAGGAWGRAPRHRVAPGDLRRLMGAALILDLAGIAAAVAHYATLATLAIAGGVAAAALVGWLSRGAEAQEPPDDGPRPPAPPSPPEPDGMPALDWARFDRERHAWEGHARERPRRADTPTQS